jgi:RNA polymerase sigma-70 factor (ECF subfamily)
MSEFACDSSERGGSDARLLPLEEQRLIAAARKGCSASARRLVETHQERLFAFIWRMIRDAHDAEEVCQEAFLRAFAALDTFDARYRFSTWLFTIGYRLCLNMMRKRRDYAGDVDFSRLSAASVAGRDEEDAAEVVARTEEARAMKQAIWESVDRLSAPQRATVLLFYRESMNCQEIGEILGMPAATVKSHLHRARARLKALLSERLADGWTGVRFAAAAEG